MKFELKPDNQNVTIPELLEDLKRISLLLGKRSLTIEEYNKHGRYSSAMIKKKIGWNEALVQAGLQINKRMNISDNELLQDLRTAAAAISPRKLTQEEYNSIGKFSSATIKNKFGWNKALAIVELEISLPQFITEDDLFTNLANVWTTLGKQPGRDYMSSPLSKYSHAPYVKGYGSWRKALEAFVEYVNGNSKDTPREKEPAIQEKESILSTVDKHKTKRSLSNRLKVQVMMRDLKDGYVRCALCQKGLTWEDMHFDHKIAWANGGETTLENIQILCKEHNLAKGNLDFHG